ncbi:MAG: (2Fe-2S)-binding protein [Thermoanaerobaculia bacterium]
MNERSFVTEPCCAVPAAGGEVRQCPASGFDGKPVDWMTVAALTTGPVPAKQEFRLCFDAECDIVYYGSAGAVLTAGDLNAQPGFKQRGDGLVCYCFLHRKSDIARQLEETGRTDVFESIKSEVEAGNCACEVRSPSGKCCLGEVRETIRCLQDEMGVTT